MEISIHLEEIMLISIYLFVLLRIIITDYDFCLQLYFTLFIMEHLNVISKICGFPVSWPIVSGLIMIIVIVCSTMVMCHNICQNNTECKKRVHA